MDEKKLRQIAIMDDETMLKHVPADLFAQLALSTKAALDVGEMLVPESDFTNTMRRRYGEACELLDECYTPARREEGAGD